MMNSSQNFYPNGNDHRSPNLDEQMIQTRAELKVGDILGGQYEIRKVISKGGMGSVYIAYDKKTFEELVALKTSGII